MAQILKSNKSYDWVGTSKRSVKMSKTLRARLESPTLLPSPDRTWSHPDNNNERIMLSNGNSKVNALADRLDCKAVSYGKNAILSCPFASNCVRYCYTMKNHYPGSQRLHGNNYLMVYSKDTKSIVQSIENGLSEWKGLDIVRLNDNGDFMSLQEIIAWYIIANKYPEIVFYGYTKNTPHLYKARTQLGPFPSNLRISISDTNDNDKTMQVYMDKLDTEYPNEFRVCHIIDSSERHEQYSALPFNDEEMQAYNYTSDFKIALHLVSTQREITTNDEWDISEKLAELELSLDVKVC